MFFFEILKNEFSARFRGWLYSLRRKYTAVAAKDLKYSFGMKSVMLIKMPAFFADCFFHVSHLC